MKREYVRKIGFFTLLALLLVGWVVLFFLYEPAQVVAFIGASNGYLVAFLLSIIGALGTLTTVSTYPALYTMAAGELNPFALVAVATVGLSIGDSLFIALGRAAREVVSEGAREKAEWLLRFLHDRPAYVTQIVLFVWVGFTPLANNLLTAPLALTSFPARKMVLPVVLGNMTLPALTVLLGVMSIR